MVRVSSYHLGAVEAGDADARVRDDIAVDAAEAREAGAAVAIDAVLARRRVLTRVRRALVHVHLTVYALFYSTK